LELRDSLVQFSLLSERHTKAVAGFRIRWLDFQGLSKLLNSFVHLPLLEKTHAPVGSRRSWPEP
jgi:hypothetical protein